MHEMGQFMRLCICIFMLLLSLYSHGVSPACTSLTSICQKSHLRSWIETLIQVCLLLQGSLYSLTTISIVAAALAVLVHELPCCQAGADHF